MKVLGRTALCDNSDLLAVLRTGDVVGCASKGSFVVFFGVVRVINKSELAIDFPRRIKSVQTGKMVTQWLSSSSFLKEELTVIFTGPSDKELQSNDPRHKLQSYAQKNRLFVARVPGQVSVSGYQLLDPLDDYEPVQCLWRCQVSLELVFRDRQFQAILPAGPVGVRSLAALMHGAESPAPRVVLNKTASVRLL